LAALLLFKINAMKIHMVKDGADQVCAVFSSTKLAQQYIDIFRWTYNPLYIHTWEVDRWADKIKDNKRAYRVKMDMSGMVLDIQMLRTPPDEMYEIKHYESGIIGFTCFARDSKHAVKQVNSERIKLMSKQ
jgi:hypothetical protein